MADMDVAIYINRKRQRSPDAERPVGSGLRTPEKKARMSVRIYINGELQQLAESTSPVPATPAGPEPLPVPSTVPAEGNPYVPSPR
eukprot:11227007-Lingulodinium_polyedra.AAC.1